MCAEKPEFEKGGFPEAEISQKGPRPFGFGLFCEENEVFGFLGNELLLYRSPF